MIEKSPEAFRTISEVAEELDLPQHVLRFWETRFSQIKPMKRGGGRRYYRPEDVNLLKGIRFLLYGEGYTIKGVQRILKEDGPRYVQAIGRGEQAPAPMRPELGDPEEDGEAGLDLRAAGRGESGHAAAEPEAGMEAHSPGGPVLSPEDLERLRSALDELLECERVLETLKRG